MFALRQFANNAARAMPGGMAGTVQLETKPVLHGTLIMVSCAPPLGRRCSLVCAVRALSGAAAEVAEGIGFRLTEEQRALQDLAR